MTEFETAIVAQNEIVDFMAESPLYLRDLTPEMVQPYGIFLPTIPMLEPPHADEDLWTVVQESWYVSKDGTVVHMQIGDKTDLASTPRIAKLMFGGAGRETPIAVVHDELYSQAGKRRYNIFTKEYWLPDQKWCDVVFRDGSLLCKTNLFKAMTFYRALRMFGWIAWRNYRKIA